MVQPVSAYQGDEPYLFISYSHADYEIVHSLIAWLPKATKDTAEFDRVRRDFPHLITSKDGPSV